jgi:hypothetical protein
VKRVVALIASLLAVSPAAATASHVAGAPRNDDYLQSLAINDPGTRLFSGFTDRVDTTNASVQGDLFHPTAAGGPGSGGPAEPVQGEGRRFGKTVWYDFYPDSSGLVRILATGYNAVVCLIPFSQRDASPNFREAVCSDRSSGSVEELTDDVRGGVAYTVQIGGVNDASGLLEVSVDFLPDSDGDGEVDPVDACPRQFGTRSNGCPAPVRATPRVTWTQAGQGVELDELSVTAERGARVAVSCTRDRCRTRRVQAGRGRRGRVVFRSLEGRFLPEGTRVTVRVTLPNAIGLYVRYTVRNGTIVRAERCTSPRGTRPRRTCE